uniref:Gasdermin D n=1 Tax=Mustela putorius furo TaxID=9669 RepID=M3YA88_MUSPF
MASTFEGVVKRVIRELDHGGKLIPVDSLQSSAGFQPYCLLRRKLPMSRFQKVRYTGINLSIRDILEPGAPEPDVKQSTPIRVFDCTDGEALGGGELEAAGQGRLAGKASVSEYLRISMKVCTRKVDPNVWDAMKRESPHLCSHRATDVLLYWDERGKRPKTFRPPNEGEVGASRPAPGLLRSPARPAGPGRGPGCHRKLTGTGPHKRTLLFRRRRVTVRSDNSSRSPGMWVGTHFCPLGVCPSQPGFSKVSPNPLAADQFAEVGPAFTGDFQDLQAEVWAHVRALRGLSRELCGQLLAGVAQVLREERGLQTLGDELEQGLSCGVVPTLEGPAGAVLECLVNSSGELEGQLARPVLYLAEALAVLTETQHAVLGKMLETGELSGRLDLVGSILEQSSPWQQRRDVSLPPELLGSGWGPETPAWVLLEECGLEVQADAPQVRWEPEAQDLTCALFACLVLLLGLSPDSC